MFRRYRLAISMLSKGIIFTGILSILAGCGGGGGGGGDGESLASDDEIPLELGLDGPGDVGNYFPLEIGNVWLFEGTKSSPEDPQNYHNNISINGSKVVDGITALVVEETNAYGEGAFESYIIKDLNGVVNLGSSDEDVLGTQLSNYWEGRFPLVVGESFVQLDRVGLIYSEDLDGDGLNETFDIRSIVTVVEDDISLTVPVGSFDEVVRIIRDVTIDLVRSSDQKILSVTSQENAYFAANVGWVKRTITTSAEGVTDVADEVLTAYSVDGQSAGFNQVTGSIIDGRVDGQGAPAGDSAYYVFSVESGNNMTISMTGLTNDADLLPISPSVCSQANTERLDTNPEDCQVITTSNKLIVAVNSVENAQFTLSVAPTPMIAIPANEGVTVPVAIAPDKTTAGQVAARGTSFYSTTGLVPGTYTVSISALSDDADLHVYSDDTYSFELDCTSRAVGDVVNYPEDCTVANTTELAFAVGSGELNQEGASYIILVR